MKERPILWSAPMVLALLAGRKTQTRRLVKPQTEHRPIGWGTAENGDDKAIAVKPLANVGDILWGRETFHANKGKPPQRVWYRADDPALAVTWKPSIFMPRWASRLLHDVTAVRVERLQDISEADAIAEGLESYDDDGVTYWGPLNSGHFDPRQAYFDLWDSINGVGSAATSPWVWVISFREVKP